MLMRPELIGTSRDTKVYWVDNPEDYELYDDIVIDRRTYIAYYKGYVVGSLAHGAGSFQTFDEDKFYKLKKGTYKERVEPVAEKPQKKEEVKVAMAADPIDIVSITIGSVKNFDSVFADLSAELDKLMEGLTI